MNSVPPQSYDRAANMYGQQTNLEAQMANRRQLADQQLPAQLGGQPLPAQQLADARTAGQLLATADGRL